MSLTCLPVSFLRGSAEFSALQLYGIQRAADSPRHYLIRQAGPQQQAQLVRLPPEVSWVGVWNSQSPTS